MTGRYQAIPVELKTAAFKSLLQGPQHFAQFSSRFGVSHSDIQNWLEEAAANLALIESEDAGWSSSRVSPLLTSEERKTLLDGKAPEKLSGTGRT